MGAILQHFPWDPEMVNSRFLIKHANFLRTFPKTANSNANREKHIIYFVTKPNVHYQSTTFGIMGITKVFTNVVDNIFLVENTRTDKTMQ